MSTNSIDCPNCGLQVPPGTQFCPRCRCPLNINPNWSQHPYNNPVPPNQQPTNKQPTNQRPYGPYSGPGPNNPNPPGNGPGPYRPYPPGNGPGPYNPNPPGNGPDTANPIPSSSINLPDSRKIAAIIVSVCCVLAALVLILYMKGDTFLPNIFGNDSGNTGASSSTGTSTDTAASGESDTDSGESDTDSGAATTPEEETDPSDEDSSKKKVTSSLADQEEEEEESEEGETSQAETGQEDTQQEEIAEEETEEYAENTEPTSGLMDMDALKSIAKSKSSKAVYSTCIYDFTTNKYSGTSNYQTAMSSSVLIDIPILYAVAVMEDEGALSLDDRITFHYTTDGRGELKKSDDGKQFTIRNLLSIMFRSSDNNVTNTFLNFFSYEGIEDICHTNGYSSVKIANLIGKTTDYTSNDNYISAYDLCMMSRELYSDRYHVGRQFLESYMVVTDSAGLKGIGRDISCSHFMNINGVKKEKFNELAIVENGDKAYIVAFLSNSDKLETLENIAAAFGSHINKILK